MCWTATARRAAITASPASGMQLEFGAAKLRREPEVRTTTGLQYLRARYYNTGIGIFTAKDPFAGVSGLPKTFNPYQYAFNNPILLADPSGESVLLAWAVETIIMGAVGFAVGFATGFTIGCITWEAALSGECGCDMQEEAMKIGSKSAWNLKFAISGAVLGGLIPMIINLGAAATILVGGATVVMSVIDLYNTIQIMINETGVTACTVGRLILDLVGIVSGSVLIKNGYLQFRETGKWFKIGKGTTPSRDPNDITRQENYPDPPPASETNRIGNNQNQNNDVQAFVEWLRQIGAKDIRVNQEQVNFDGTRVGRNRPDLQFNYNGQRYYVEWDTSMSSRGAGHAVRIQSNDPTATGVLPIDGDVWANNLSGLFESIINGWEQIILITRN
jgi:RHS repeat-associated protein